MDKEKILHFGMLGSFSYGEKGNKDMVYEGGSLKTGKKALSFLQYMIVHHARCVSSEELIEQFWAEGDSKAPGNALRYMLFKVRLLLKEMFPEQGELLLTFPGGYRWSGQASLELDTEQFEKCCMEARKQPAKESLGLLLEAISLYRGDFIPGNDSEWAVMTRQYYRTLYLDACKAVLPLLHKQERWTELIGICERAYQADFSAEEFTAYQMRALIALGQPEAALAVYGTYRVRLEQEYELSPSEELELIRALALGMRKKELDATDIFRLVSEEESEQKAFFCTFEMFRNIVALEKRHLARSGLNSTLVIISLEKKGVPTTDMRRLERILLNGLRVSDPVARVEVGAYILLLTGADEEHAKLVVNRLDIDFHKTYRRSKANLTYHIAAL